MTVPPDYVLEAIAIACLGDLRQAISQLQMYMIGKATAPVTSALTLAAAGAAGAGAGAGAGAAGDTGHGLHGRGSRSELERERVQARGSKTGKVDMDPEAGSRDKAYSFLHGVAKLLWAEVRTEQSTHTAAGMTQEMARDDEALDEEEQEEKEAQFRALYKLRFPPDSVVRRLELPLDMAMNFLQFNYPPIFEQAEAKHKSSLSGAKKSMMGAVAPSSRPLPLPSYDYLDRASRLSDMLSEADMLHTCQFSTNLPIDRAQSSSFPMGKRGHSKRTCL